MSVDLGPNGPDARKILSGLEAEAERHFREQCVELRVSARRRRDDQVFWARLALACVFVVCALQILRVVFEAIG